MHKHRACVKLYCVLLSLLTDDHIVNVRFPIHHLRSCIFLFFGTPCALFGYVEVIEVITHWCFTQHFYCSYSLSLIFFCCHVCVSVYSSVSADPVVSCGWERIMNLYCGIIAPPLLCPIAHSG